MTPLEWTILFLALALLAFYAGAIKKWIEDRGWEEIEKALKEAAPN